MDELQAIYRKALPARIAALEAARAAGGTDGDAETRSIAHSLRGSGGTYGFPQITAAAAAVEAAPAVELRARVDELIAVLWQTAGGEPDADAEPALRVLLVDDDPEIRLIVSYLLGSAGYVVSEAEDAAGAAAALAVARPDVILMDVMLGAEDGVAVAAALVRSMAGPPPRLIFLTGSVRAEEFERMNAAGPAGIIHKPFDPDSFLSLFQRLLSIAPS